MNFGGKLDTARARERRALDQLTGNQPLRRWARWVERSVAVAALLIVLLAVVGALVTVRAVERSSGRQDQRITAVTAAAAQLDAARQTAAGEWVADVTWTDPAGAVHRGHVSVPGNVAVGTPVPARLAHNGVVRSAPDTVIDTWCVAIMACIGIGVIAVALGLIVRELIHGLAQRIRLAAWQVAWAQWQPTAPRREEL
jgi:hypothetical protein